MIIVAILFVWLHIRFEMTINILYLLSFKYKCALFCARIKDVYNVYVFEHTNRNGKWKVQRSVYLVIDQHFVVLCVAS